MQASIHSDTEEFFGIRQYCSISTRVSEVTNAPVALPSGNVEEVLVQRVQRRGEAVQPGWLADVPAHPYKICVSSKYITVHNMCIWQGDVSVFRTSR
jgi:hypothetical protein